MTDRPVEIGSDALEPPPVPSTVSTFDLLARQAGAELRRPASSTELARVRARARRQRAARTILASGGAVVLVAVVLGWFVHQRSAEPVGPQPGTTIVSVPSVVLRGHTAQVIALGMAADGRRVMTASADGTVRMFDTHDGTETLRIDSGAALTAASLSADGALIAAAGPSSVVVFDAHDGHERVRLDGAGPIAFDPATGRIATSAGVWVAATGELVTRFDHPAVFVGFNDDGTRLVQIDDARQAHVWDLDAGRIISTIDVVGVGTPAAVSPNGWLLAASVDQSTAEGQRGSGWLRVWDLDTGAETMRADVGVTSLMFSDDGTALLAGQRRTAEIAQWSVRSGDRVTQPMLGPGPTWAMASSRDGRSHAAVGDAAVSVWRASGGVAPRTEVLPPSRFEGFNDIVAISADGSRVVATNGDNPLVLTLPTP